MGAVTVLGVRHHGPGSARAVRGALGELEPDAVLIEGPPEAEAVIALAADPEMRPPVALLVYAADNPRRAAFYPLAVFSPEWQAVRYALSAEVPVRFIDLPAAHSLAGEAEDADEPARDPIRDLAAIAGQDDPERWWEDVVELRAGALDAFAAVGEAMAALREDSPELGPRAAQREAAMRRAVRTAQREGFERVAIVCGAWHAPALEPGAFPPKAHDDALLRGLPKTKVLATWVPWTNDRLALASGYGAGVTSPGWYHHLFTAPEATIARWMQRAAALLRDEGLDASPASVVESVRLADALAAVRARPRPGLAEVSDAALAVLGQGREPALALIARRLVVGEVLGGVPAQTPMVPLASDLVKLQRRLRLAPEASVSQRELDLRKELDLERSSLLHRLVLLGVPWGQPARSETRSRGTFRETWQLAWQPEFAVRLIEVSRYGGTVAAAAAGISIERARGSESLAELTALVEATLLAALPDALSEIMAAVSDRAARDGDVGRLMDALAPLARVHRYGSVRNEDVGDVRRVIEGLVARVCVGLHAALLALDDDAARAMVGRVDAVDDALGTLGSEDLRAEWHAALASVASGEHVHRLLSGRATRVLLDAGRIESDAARARMGLELSLPAEADRGAAWVEGFLAGSGLVLLHDAELLILLDTWLTAVSGERFDDVLPLLRRSFSAFPAGERRQIGARVKTLGAPERGPARRHAQGPEIDVDLARGDAALRTVLELLGIPSHE